MLFDNLETYTNYVFVIYAKVGDEFVSLAYQGSATTPKQIPLIEYVLVTITENNGVEKYEIEMILDDPNEAVTYAVLHVGKNKYWINGNKFSYSKDSKNLGNVDDWYIEINYNLQSGNGIVEEEVKNIKIYYGQLESAIDCQLENIQDLIIDIFTN